MKLYDVSTQDTSKELEIRANGSMRVATFNTEESLTEQQHAEACDVNNIMAQYKRTGVPPAMREAGVYADISTLPADYMEAVNTIQEADAAFNALPSEVRIRFKNDPSQMLAFLEDKNNYDEAVSLGMVLPKQTPTSQTPTSQTPNTKTSNE